MISIFANQQSSTEGRMVRSCIVVPKTILSPNEVQVLSPQERDFYIRNVVLEILRSNDRQGITVSQVVSATNFNRMTVGKHLDVLVAIGEAYKVQRGNLFIYYKNGKIVHETDFQSIALNDKSYTFYKLENNDGKFVYIQERELDECRVSQIKGGIMISVKDVPHFLTKLREFMEKEGSKWITT